MFPGPSLARQDDSQGPPGYTGAMTRFAAGQPDLFAPTEVSVEAPPPEHSPLVELTALLAELRAADGLPWPDVGAAMAAEQRMLAQARMAGAEGKKLAVAIMDEIERLFAADEQAAANAYAIVAT